MYYYTTRFYNKTLTFTSIFTAKSLETMLSDTDMQETPLKIITIVLVLETNTGDVGDFLQVQHYWGVNICCELINASL